MKNRKQIYLLISVIALCALLFTIYFAITLYRKERTDDPSEGSDNVYIYVDQNAVDKISYFSFTGPDEELAFKKNDDIWVYEHNNTLAVNSARIEEFLENCEVIVAKKLISDDINDKDLEQYGLDDPQFTLKLISDGIKKTFLFGDTIASKGLCYMIEKGSTSLYLVEQEYISSFSVPLLKFFTIDSHTAAKADEIRRIILTHADNSKEILPSGVEGSEASKLISAVSSIEITEFVDFGSDCFNVFGLSEADAITMNIETNQRNISYVFGLGESQEFIYLLVENEKGVRSDMVYLFSCKEFSHLYSLLASI